jgi:DNA-binding MarR family transcriptional regulator
MSSQLLNTQSMSATTFGRLLRAHAELTRSLSGTLEAVHGLTISDLEVLLRLEAAPERRMKRVELASRVLLTPSGVTRLLDGLESRGLVERAACATDRRVTYAVLTGDGERVLHDALDDHVAELDELLAARLSPDEIEALGILLGRLAPAEDDDPCGT